VTESPIFVLNARRLTQSLSDVAENEMDVDNNGAAAAVKEVKPGFRLERNEKQKKHKASRIQKAGRHSKPRNQIVFAKTGKAKSRSKR